MAALARLRNIHVPVRAIVDSPTPWCDAWLASRMAGWAIVLPVLKHFVPVRTLARMMWRDARTTGRDAIREEQVVRLAGWLSRATNVTARGACMQRSLLAYRYLSEAGADPRLVIAFGRKDGKVAGHAWVEVDGQAVGECEEGLRSFTRFLAFGPRGLVLPGPRASDSTRNNDR